MTDMPAPPSCPVHGEMVIAEISTGDDEFLAVFWFCRLKECDECEDYDENVYGRYEPKYSSRKPKQYGLWEKCDQEDEQE